MVHVPKVDPGRQRKFAALTLRNRGWTKHADMLSGYVDLIDRTLRESGLQQEEKAGIVGLPTSKQFSFSGAGGRGDHTGKPPPSPTIVNLEVVGGLTGDEKDDTVSPKLRFTKEKDVTVQVEVHAAAGSSIQIVTVLALHVTFDPDGKFRLAEGNAIRAQELDVPVEEFIEEHRRFCLRPCRLAVASSPVFARVPCACSLD